MNRSRILARRFIYYKLFNSLFLGLNVGTIFTIYAPLEPSIYSIGGIVLALGMLLVAKFYEKLLNVAVFFRISLFVELVVLALILYYLLFPYGYQTALFVYIGYQITFMFGAYLVRAETLFLSKKKLLSLLDIAKQSGYLAGMLLAYLFYSVLESYIGEKVTQVYFMHFLLLFDEVLTVYFLNKAFRY